MRWKIIGVSSLAAAVAGVTLWSLMVIAAFGTARSLAKHGWLFLASALIPFGLIFIAVFLFALERERRTRHDQVHASLWKGIQQLKGIATIGRAAPGSVARRMTCQLS